MSNAPHAVESILRLDNVSRVYQSGGSDLTVLDGVSLDIAAGEIVGLIGPSGSGKSSLLHAAGMLERPSAGDVWIDGQSGWDLSDGERTGIRRNRIGFVYQFHHLLPEFDAIHNVALPALIAGRKRKDAMEEAERLLGVMGLSDRIYHQPAQLSGGEQQRVAIARAMINNPILILADEPTGNLDPANKHRVLSLLLERAAELGATVIVVTHDHGLLDRFDRVHDVTQVAHGSVAEGAST